MLDNDSLTKRYTEIKRKLFDKAYGHLNSKQREAAFTVNGPLLVLAGAGSGKTTVLVNRIEYMLRYGNTYFSEKIPPDIDEEKISELEKAQSLSPQEIKSVLDEIKTSVIKPYNVLSITFTNKAAGEMKERLVKALGSDGAEGLWAGTFHSVCLRILRRFWWHLLPPPVRKGKTAAGEYTIHSGHPHGGRQFCGAGGKRTSTQFLPHGTGGYGPPVGLFRKRASLSGLVDCCLS